jgi:putative SOS response-associated peptidase YedK
MCGRYALAKIADDLIEEFDLDDDAHAFLNQPNYNIAPTVAAPVVRERLGDDGLAHRELALLRWGLIPSWAKEAKIGVRMINARAETLLEKPAFRAAASARRALIPADGWYEWVAGPDGKRAHFMSLREGRLCAFAGLFESWTDPSGQRVESFAVITTAAEAELKPVHDRMPVVLPPDRWAEWLDPNERSGPAVASMIADLPTGRFQAWPVSSLVNAVRHNGPECIARVDR